MKKIITIMSGLLLTTGLALAQNGPGPGTSSNYVNQANDYSHLWGTNCLAMTNAPKAWSNNFQHVVGVVGGSGNEAQNRFGKQKLPADVQTIVQQFQQDRTRIMSQLKTCSDEQRQQSLKELDQLRVQMRDQISKVREDARQQADQMRTRFGNNRDAILNQGSENPGVGRDR